MPAQHTHMDHISMIEHKNVSAIPRVHKKRPTACVTVIRVLKQNWLHGTTDRGQPG